MCPLPYDQSFVEIFYQGWNIIKMFLNADAHLPKEVLLPRGADRFVCKEMEIRRNFPVVDVIDAFSILQQPCLVVVNEGEVSLHSTFKDAHLNKIIAPMAIDGSK